eukprot:CAMPEP_0172452988 /NCGR_PEP_ID=MMETSP1065-20121228/10488_1 /TAXON_ID=265537 /ORGANISM="Amphiprora paludosa, Strain CCMP125" /LENGTH=449 /DNA_ID=CAMNT_0013205141 /DNA_START=120 /DNA_END=1469 /DNA_ORIENTATION=+
MWNALTSDLNEFVSTVAGDTSETLNRMDESFPDGGKKEQISPAAEERLRRMDMHETFDSPLVSEEDPEDYKKDVEAFLSDFSIDAQTDEIAKLLEENPDTLKLAFEALVPTKVKYEDFWQRYFYRCDEERIAAEIEEEEREEAAAREQAFKSLSSVGNLLGGAVKAVSASLTEDSSKANKDSSFQLNQASNPGIFGPGGRPPFVMNTAVSEDEEEEEELGWDDDEEDDEAEEDQEDQIEFNDAVTDKLKEELKLAIEERDQLHETVKMQQNEIASLKTNGAESTEIEQLKTSLFEKESEIAALRASALDTSGEVAVEGDAVASFKAELKALQAQLAGERKAHEATRAEKSSLNARVTALEADVQGARAESAKLKDENTSLQRKLEISEQQVKSFEEELRKVEQTDEPGDDGNGDEQGEESVESPNTELSGVKVDGENVPEPGGGWDDDW